MESIALGRPTSTQPDAAVDAPAGPASASRPESADAPRRPTSFSPRDLGFTPRKSMVRWLSPKELSATAVRVLLSAVFGAYSDKREIQAALPPSEPVSYAGDPEVWLDYVADLGDGFGPTYTLASLLAKPNLRLRHAGGEPTTTDRGRLLVMGGDEVYPVGSIDAYRDRTLGPYRAALPYVADEDRAPDLFAIPGNHDWYDGLTAFMRVFCREQWIGGWRARQRRSYFAVKLRENWWLWGIDIQFDSYIDSPQYDYFNGLAETRMNDGDAVILCSAVPSWVHANDGDRPEAFASLDFFERTVIRDNNLDLRLSLAGDAHHYARYVRDDGGAQRITAGGGGAYLSATHNLPESLTLPPDESQDIGKSETTEHYCLQTTYPSKSQSKKLRWRTLALPFQNWSMWALIGAIYLVYAWMVHTGLRSGWTAPSGGGAGGPGPSFSTLMAGTSIGGFARAVPGSFSIIALSLVVIAGVSGFTKSKTFWKRAVGALHGLVHVALTIVAIGLASGVVGRLGVKGGWCVAGFTVLVGVGGGLLGCWLLAAYLVFADRYLDCNANELFAAQRNRDHKSFLRIHFDAAGDVTVYPVKVARTPRRWTLSANSDPEASWFESDVDVTPELIEAPIRIAGPRAIQARDAVPALAGADRTDNAA